MGHFPKKGVYRLRKALKRGPCKRTLDPNEVPTGLQLGFAGGEKGQQLTFYAVSLHGTPLPTDQWHSQHGVSKALDRSSSNTTDH